MGGSVGRRGAYRSILSKNVYNSSSIYDYCQNNLTTSRRGVVVNTVKPNCPEPSTNPGRIECPYPFLRLIILTIVLRTMGLKVGPDRGVTSSSGEGSLTTGGSNPSVGNTFFFILLFFLLPCTPVSILSFCDWARLCCCACRVSRSLQSLRKS